MWPSFGTTCFHREVSKCQALAPTLEPLAGPVGPSCSGLLAWPHGPQGPSCVPCAAHWLPGLPGLLWPQGGCGSGADTQSLLWVREMPGPRPPDPAHLRTQLWALHSWAPGPGLQIWSWGTRPFLTLQFVQETQAALDPGRESGSRTHREWAAGQWAVPGITGSSACFPSAA